MARFRTTRVQDASSSLEPRLCALSNVCPYNEADCTRVLMLVSADLNKSTTVSSRVSESRSSQTSASGDDICVTRTRDVPSRATRTRKLSERRANAKPISLAAHHVLHTTPKSSRQHCEQACGRRGIFFICVRCSRCRNGYHTRQARGGDLGRHSGGDHEPFHGRDSDEDTAH